MIQWCSLVYKHRYCVLYISLCIYTLLLYACMCVRMLRSVMIVMLCCCLLIMSCHVTSLRYVMLCHGRAALYVSIKRMRNVYAAYMQHIAHAVYTQCIRNVYLMYVYVYRYMYV